MYYPMAGFSNYCCESNLNIDRIQIGFLPIYFYHVQIGCSANIFVKFVYFCSGKKSPPGESGTELSKPVLKNV